MGESSFGPVRFAQSPLKERVKPSTKKSDGEIGALDLIPSPFPSTALVLARSPEIECPSTSCRDVLFRLIDLASTELAARLRKYSGTLRQNFLVAMVADWKLIDNTVLLNGTGDAPPDSSLCGGYRVGREAKFRWTARRA